MDVTGKIGKMVTIHSYDGIKRQTFNLFQIKQYYKSVNESSYRFESGVLELLPYQVFLTEMVQSHDPRALKFDKAKRKEIEGLKTWHLENGLLRVCSRQIKYLEPKDCSSN